jgi:hypothetical protein
MATSRIFQSMCTQLLKVSRDADTKVCFPSPSNGATTRLDITSYIREIWFGSLMDHRSRQGILRFSSDPQYKRWGITSITSSLPSESFPFRYPFYRLTLLSVCYWQKRTITRKFRLALPVHITKVTQVIYACSYAELLLEKGSETYIRAWQLGNAGNESITVENLCIRLNTSI